MDQDFCQECVPGKQITGDKIKCLPSIEQCEIYDNSTTKNDSQLICS